MIRPFSPEKSGPLAANGEPTVTQDDLLKVLYDAAIMLDRAGGSIYVTVQRSQHAEGPGMATTNAVVVWQPFTKSKPVPEEATGENELDPQLAEEIIAAAPPPEDVIDDGLRVDPEAEDLSEVPPALRAGV